MRLQPEINLSWCIPFIPLFGEQFEERGKNSRSVFSETTQHPCSFLTRSKLIRSLWVNHHDHISPLGGVRSPWHRLKKEYVGPASGVLCLVPKTGHSPSSCFFLNISPSSTSQLPSDTVSFFFVFIPLFIRVIVPTSKEVVWIAFLVLEAKPLR